MRILMLSLDTAIKDPESPVAKRLAALSEAVGKTTPTSEDGGTPFNNPPGQPPLLRGIKGDITVFVPAERDEKRGISPHLTVYSFGGPKIIQLWKMWKKAKSLILNPLSLTHSTQHVDLITVQDAYFLGLLGYKLSRRFKVPLEIQMHGLEKFFGVRRLIAEFVLRRASKIRVVSKRLQTFLSQGLRIKDDRFYTLPVYTQTESFILNPRLLIGGQASSLTQRRRKTVPYPFTFLTVGRLVPVKNIGMQIRAFARLVKEVPHIRLRVVGEGPLAVSLKLQVKSLELEDKVSFEGYQKELEKYYEEADAFLLTSDSEGWGRVALEAAAYRLPIIMTNVGLANEVLHHDKEAIVIPVGDEEQLYLAMKELLDKPEFRRTLGDAAYRAFLALPKQEEQIQKQVEAWRSLAA